LGELVSPRLGLPVSAGSVLSTEGNNPGFCSTLIKTAGDRLTFARRYTSLSAAVTQ